MMMDAKIKKYARRCEFIAWVLMGWGIVRLLGTWFADLLILKCVQNLANEKFKWLDAVINADLGGEWIGLENLAKLSLTSRIFCFLVDGIAVGILITGFWFFIKLMRELKKGSVFSSEVIELLNKLAKTFFWFTLYIPVNRTIIGLIVTFQNPPGQRFLVTTINFGDVFTLAASWFFVILTSLMRESRQLQSDRDLTI